MLKRSALANIKAFFLDFKVTPSRKKEKMVSTTESNFPAEQSSVQSIQQILFPLHATRYKIRASATSNEIKHKMYKLSAMECNIRDTSYLYKLRDKKCKIVPAPADDNTVRYSAWTVVCMTA
jgi:hypothetical protein